MFVPQIDGGSFPVCPAAANESSQSPAVVGPVANPEKVWKSNLSWQMSSETFLIVKVQDPALLAV